MAAADILSFDPYKANAYSEAVKFDLGPKNGTHVASAPVANEENIDPRDVTFHPEVSTKLRPSKDWEIDVRGLISTKKWLQNYGLKKNRLDMHQILPTIGFKHSDEYDGKIKKPICSRYGADLFPKVNRNDGKSFNISLNRDKLTQIESRLNQAVGLYKHRLEWLTTESRRIFGVIEERAVSLVLDIKNMSPQQFDQYRAAVERIIKEQVAQCAKFNIFRACNDMKPYEKECVPVTISTIEGAIDWLWKLERLAPTGDTATCEAVTHAMADNTVEAVYLFTEGSSCDGSREILKEKVTGAHIPLHVVSYNCTSPSTIHFLKDLTKITNARFHAYGIVMEMDHYEGATMDPSTNQANIILRKKTFGGVPHGAGVREDVILLFEELEEARHTLAQVQTLLINMPHAMVKEHQIDDREPSDNENYMTSREWLDKYGLKPQKLGFYDILSSVAFKHRDGVIDLKEAPPNEEIQTDAVSRQKLVNARYCESFPHVRWKNGDLMHVQVTPDVHRSYEIRMNRALEGMQQRIDWLQQGSRELFGTVIEDKIYILIDTSASMDPHIQFVKDKLFVLMQEQLRHKQKFNLISFDSKVNPWWERLVDVNEKNLQGAWQWVKNLGCKGSTNTLAAIKLALSDPNTQAIYLLSDGRPDQPPKSILAQVQLQPQIPIHTISFNCSDSNANQFLCQLAKDTGGRFHYYSDHGMELEGPDPWESEDIRLLKQEKALGLKNLEQIGQLRDECATLAWKREEPVSLIKKENASDKESAMPPFDSKNLYRSEILERPSSAPGFRHSPVPPHTPCHGALSVRPATSHGYRPKSAVGYKPTNRGRSIHMARPKSARSTRIVSPQYSTKAQTPRLSISSGILVKKSSQPLHAGHTKTSILRTLNSPGHFQQKEWLLPETRNMLDDQWQRQRNHMKDEETNTKEYKRKTKKMTNEKNISSKKWLAVHGLAANKLTILDALAPTFIPHKPKFIPILNKHVLSKVFDDILPLAHASGQNRKRVRIVNPQGVDLETYEKKVQTAVDKYTRRLNRIVWDALPQEEKDSFECDEPISFMENRKDMIDALDRCSWPIREQDIIRLEDEIKQGCTYIQQAKDLREMAEDGGKSNDEEGLTSDDQYNKKIFKTKPPRKTRKKKLSLRYGGKSQRKVIEPMSKSLNSDGESDVMSRHSDEGSIQSDGSKHSARVHGSQKSDGSQRSACSEKAEYELNVTHETSQDGDKDTVRRTNEVVMQNEQDYEVSYC